MTTPLLSFNKSQSLAHQHFDERVNREANLLATVDGSKILFTADVHNYFYDPLLYPYHINYFTFNKLFELLNNKKNLVIVETGTSANATDSTSLFDSYAKYNNGEFITIDIEPSRSINSSLKWSKHTTPIVSDSVKYLKDWKLHHGNKKIDVVYLDSWDIDWLNPQASQNHGLDEFNCIIPHLADEAYILIDDTPESPKWLPFRNEEYNKISQSVSDENLMPGKGAYIPFIIKDDPRFSVILHQYQILYKYTASNI